MSKIPKPLLIAVAAAVLLLIFSVKDKGAGASTGSDACRFTVNADVLNVRASPDVHADAVDTLSQGSETDAEPTVRHGFRRLDEGQWVASRYLSPVSHQPCR